MYIGSNSVPMTELDRWLGNQVSSAFTAPSPYLMILQEISRAPQGVFLFFF
jgi:hypothetical protein